MTGCRNTSVIPISTRTTNLVNYHTIAVHGREQLVISNDAARLQPQASPMTRTSGTFHKKSSWDAQLGHGDLKPTVGNNAGSPLEHEKRTPYLM
jgi:hypothetical protein